MIGSKFSINLVSSPRATAKGRVLSKNKGSCFKNSLICFSSQLLINFLYHSICDSNLYHSSVNDALCIIPRAVDNANHVIDHNVRYKLSLLTAIKSTMKNNKKYNPQNGPILIISD